MASYLLRLDPQLLDALAARAAEDGLPMRAALIQLIQAYVAGDVEIRAVPMLWRGRRRRLGAALPARDDDR